MPPPLSTQVGEEELPVTSPGSGTAMTAYEKDQDTVKLGNSINPASKRHGSVWGADKRQELAHQAAATYRSTLQTSTSIEISPGRLGVADEIKQKRREAAKWIAQLTGEFVPFTNDREFRAALWSGVLLCKVMNEVAPGTIKVVHDLNVDVIGNRQRYENVQSFMSEATAMGVPADYMLSMADLESDSTEDKPRVVDCILWLKRLHGSSAAPSPAVHSMHGSNGATDSPRRAAAHSTLVRALQRSITGPADRSTPAQTKGASPCTTIPRDMNNDQIHALQGVSNMLKEKMSYQADVHNSSRQKGGVYGNAVDAMGPVLENVLGNLTQEYERRLLGKDQEIQGVKEKLSSAQKELDTMHNTLDTMRQELDVARQQAACEAELNNSARIAAAEARVAELQEEVAQLEATCQSLRQELSVQNGAVDEVKRQMQLDLDDARDQLEQMEQVTENYKQIQDENRRLYNAVQDLKGAIRVFCRIRPAGKTGDQTPVCIDVGSDQDLAAYDPKATGSGQPKTFKFDRVFGESTSQEEIYADTQPLIRSVLDGYNVCIFAYGQTGSGKTHTMSGTEVHSHQGRGINYRALDDLFALRDKREGEVEYEIQVQMLEIYNESLRDLLVDGASSSAASNKLEILNTQASGCNVPLATKIQVRNTDDVMDMMSRGSKNRHSAETKMNQRSSRSHQVLTVIVDGFNVVTGAKSHGCLHLIDLAGSERTSKSEVTGDRLVEANHINTSLSALGSVMAALASKNKHIPFRDSKLTQLLADSLSGQAKVMMFMHISPENSSYQETTSTLKFAERVSAITLGEAKKNVESGEVFKCHEEISRLRSAMERKDAEIAMLMSRLREAEDAHANLAAHVIRTGGDERQDGQPGEVTPYQSVGSVTVESRLPSTLSPAHVPRGTPIAISPFGSLTPMQTIKEDHGPPGGAAPAQVTPNSARSSGVHKPRSSLSNLKPSMSMRDGGRWAGASPTSLLPQLIPTVRESVSSLPAASLAPRPSSSLPTSSARNTQTRPPTAPTTSSGRVASSIEPSSAQSSLMRSSTTSRLAPPRVSASGPTLAPSASARQSTTWGRSSTNSRLPASGAAAAAGASAQQQQKVERVPASAGGQRSSTWGGGTGRGRWN